MSKKQKEEKLNLFYMNNEGAENKSAPRKDNIKKAKATKRKEAIKGKKEISINEKDKAKNTKKRRISKKKVVLFLLKWTSILVLIIGSFIFLTTTPIFNIKEIKVKGNEQVTYDEIVSLSGLQKDTNLLKNTKATLEKCIKQNAYIKNVEIKRILPDTIEINVEEKQKAFMLKFVNGYAYVDSQGYILQISSEKIQLPILNGYVTNEEDIVPGNRLCSEDLEKLEIAIKIVQAVKEAGIEQQITSVNISNKQEYSIYIKKEKKEIYLGDGSNLTDKMLYAKAILEAEKENEGEIFLNGDLNNKFQPFFREKV